MANDILTREQYERLLDRRLAEAVRDLLEKRRSQNDRMLARWDAHHAGDCRCPVGEPHGVRLSSEDWTNHYEQELDDAEAYVVFDDEKFERGLFVLGLRG